MSLNPGAEGRDDASPSTRVSVDEDAVETGDGTLAQDIFSNLLIREEILKNLHVSDLLTASLVCKEWKRFCRDTLREKRRCLAKVGRKKACHDLERLSLLLETSDCIPFNGLSVAFHPTLACACYPITSEEALEIGANILAAVDIKYLTIRVDVSQKYSVPSKNICVSMGPVRAVLKERAAFLEELRFIGSEVFGRRNNYLDLLGFYDDNFLLPNVRCLEFPSTLFGLEHVRYPFQYFGLDSAVDRLTSISPKLEEIRGKITENTLEFLLSKGVAQLVKEFHFHPSPHQLGSVYQFALTNPKLHQLQLSSNRSAIQPEQGLEVLKLLLQSCKKSLRMLAIENEDLGFMISQWNDLPAVENVEQLRLGFDHFLNLPYDATVPLRKMEWSKYFPNLQQVCIDYAKSSSYHAISAELDFVFGGPDGLIGLPGEHSCNTVTKVIFTQDHLQRAHPIQFDLFKKVFPNVKSCLVEQNSLEKTMHLSNLWSAWPDLEEICVFGLTPSCGNYDEEFKGISKEEAKTLKEDFGGAFESLELVPVQPNILSFQKLKKLALQVNRWYPRVSYAGTAFLSSGVCRWMQSRIPGLVFEIDTHSRHIEWSGHNSGTNTYIEHLLPFAKLARQNFRPYF